MVSIYIFFFLNTGTWEIATFKSYLEYWYSAESPCFANKFESSMNAEQHRRGFAGLPYYLPSLQLILLLLFALYTCQHYWSSLVACAGSRSAGRSRPTIKGRWPENLVSAVNGMCIQNSVWWDWSARIYRAQQHDESKARSKKLLFVLCLSENFACWLLLIPYRFLAMFGIVKQLCGLFGGPTLTG